MMHLSLKYSIPPLTSYLNPSEEYVVYLQQSSRQVHHAGEEPREAGEEGREYLNEKALG